MFENEKATLSPKTPYKVLKSVWHCLWPEICFETTGSAFQLDLGAIQCEGNWGPRRKRQENVYCDGERTLEITGPRYDTKLWRLDNELASH